MGFFDNLGTSLGDNNGVGGIVGTGLEILDGIIKVKQGLDSLHGEKGSPAPTAPTVTVDPALRPASSDTAPLLVIGLVGLVLVFAVLR